MNKSFKDIIQKKLVSKVFSNFQQISSEHSHEIGHINVIK